MTSPHQTHFVNKLSGAQIMRHISGKEIVVPTVCGLNPNAHWVKIASIRQLATCLICKGTIPRPPPEKGLTEDERGTPT